MWDRLGQAALLNSAAQMNVVPTVIEAAAEVAEDPYAMSWLEPFEGPSRALGAAVSGVNPLAWGEGGINPEAPTLGEALVDKGAPPWVGLASELLLVPDPVMAGKAADMFFLAAMIPGFKGFRALLRGMDESSARRIIEEHLPPGAFGVAEDLSRVPELKTPEQLEAVAEQLAQGANELREASKTGAIPPSVKVDVPISRLEAAASRAALEADVLRYREGKPVVPLTVTEDAGRILDELADIGLQGGVIPADLEQRALAVSALRQTLEPFFASGDSLSKLLAADDPRGQRLVLAIQALGDERSLMAMDWPLMGTASGGTGFDAQDVWPVAASLAREDQALDLFMRGERQRLNMQGLSDEAFGRSSNAIHDMWRRLDERSKAQLEELMLSSSMGTGYLDRAAIEAHGRAAGSVAEGSSFADSRRMLLDITPQEAMDGERLAQLAQQVSQTIGVDLEHIASIARKAQSTGDTGPTLDFLRQVGGLSEFEAEELFRYLAEPLADPKPPTPRQVYQEESAAGVEFDGVGGGAPPPMGDNPVRDWLDSVYDRIESNYGFNRQQFKELPMNEREVYFDDLNLSASAREEILSDLDAPTPPSRNVRHRVEVDPATFQPRDEEIAAARAAAEAVYNDEIVGLGDWLEDASGLDAMTLGEIATNRPEEFLEIASRVFGPEQGELSAVERNGLLQYFKGLYGGMN